MKTTSFQNDRRLWMWIALVLFMLSWWCPFEVKGEIIRPADIVWRCATAFFVERAYFAALIMLFALASFTAAAGVAAIFFGWLLHCVAVIIRTRVRERKSHVV